MSKNKENSESKTTTADDLFRKMFGEDLKGLPPVSKLQAKNEIQNGLFKYHMAAMQDSLKRKLNNTTMVDDNFSPSKTRKTQSSSNFRNNFHTNFSPNSSTNSSGRSHHWTQGINTNNCDFSWINTCGSFYTKYFSTSSKSNKFML